jgi:hypothetical protein
LTSWPRSIAAERNRCVLYDRGALERIASFIVKISETTRVNDDGPGATVAGWREWIALPDLGVPWVKAKLDTGARSSSIHAFDLEEFERDGTGWVSFAVHPWQRSEVDTVRCELPVADRRAIRSSTGHEEQRLVVRTRIAVVGHDLDAELTLANRDEMGFRMLVGREALRGQILVDPGRSYLGGRPVRATRRKNRGIA